MLTIGSLFSGIGGLELGLERAGLGPVKWQVEIDPYCRAVLAKHWPDVERFDDVRTVGRECLAPVDVICGGFPCQDISSAGAKAGIAGARSGLWSEYARIVGETRPRYVVVENVSALVSRGLDRVLGDLADLGFDAVWFPLAAADVGAPHTRERIFVVAYADGDRMEGPWKPYDVGTDRVCDGGGEPESPWGSCRQGHLLHVIESPFIERCGVPQPLLSGVETRVPARVERLRALGNAVVPQVAEVVGHVVLGIHRRIQAAKGE